MMLNQEQTLSIVRAVLQILGTTLTAAGVYTDAQWATITGPVIMIVPIIWGLFVHTKTATIARASAIPEVAAVITKPTAAGVEMAHAVPAANVVPAGTLQAKAVAADGA